MTSLTFYSTLGCHLCEIAESLLHAFSEQADIVITKVEIGDDDELVARYGERIPVILFDDNCELNWPFTLSDLENKLK